MNELTDQLITLFSSILITVMFLAVAVNIFRRNHAPDTRHPLKWRIPVGHLDMLDIAMCGIIVLYFSLGALLAAATPPGASAPPSTTNMELDSYKVFNGTCLNLILAFVLLVRMFHTGRMEALGLKKTFPESPPLRSGGRLSAGAGHPLPAGQGGPVPVD